MRYVLYLWQSNGVGARANQKTDQPDPNVQALDNDTLSWVSAALGRSPFNVDGSNNGSYQAAKLWSALDGEYVKIVSAAFEGRSIRWWDADQQGWLDLVERVEAARALDGPFFFDEVHLGLHESDPETNPIVYARQQLDLCTRLAAAGYAGPQTKFIISEALRNPSLGGANKQAIAGQIIHDMGNPYIEVISSEGQTYDSTIDSGVHLDFDSQTQRGQRLYAAAKSMPRIPNVLKRSIVVDKPITVSVPDDGKGFADINDALSTMAEWDFRRGAIPAGHHTGPGPLCTIKVTGELEILEPLYAAINVLHAFSDQIVITGADPIGELPRFSGDPAVDEAALRAYFPTVVNCSGTTGILLNGRALRAVKNLLFIGDGTKTGLHTGSNPGLYDNTWGGKTVLNRVAFLKFKTQIDQSTGGTIRSPRGLCVWHGHDVDQVRLGVGASLYASGASVCAPVVGRNINGIALRCGGNAHLPGLIGIGRYVLRTIGGGFINASSPRGASVPTVKSDPANSIYLNGVLR